MTLPITFQSANEEDSKVLATKEDISNVRQEITNLRAELKQDIAGLRAELKTDIANAKAEMIKWMFIFWIGTVGVLSGLMITLFNVYIKH